ncbi:hypothetical protein O0Q50_22050 [Priestia aryabhattai]|uniref:Uncharacterized protein n=1 Tax=Priestia aryabhattai TaxID=412384 RepID=A0AAX6NDQ6_PRIAR|nr:hypothetical protein [Priestia aryabhattai]MDU9693866.1 hypothetical protein [Priestia aryabhattai]
MSKKEVLTPYQYGEKACRENKAFLSFMDQQFEKNHIDGKNLEEMRVSDAEWTQGYMDESNKVKTLNARMELYKSKVLTPFEYGEKACRNKILSSPYLDIEFCNTHLSGGKGDQEIYNLENQWYKGYENELDKQKAELAKLQFKLQQD